MLLTTKIAEIIGFIIIMLCFVTAFLKEEKVPIGCRIFRKKIIGKPFVKVEFCSNAINNVFCCVRLLVITLGMSRLCQQIDNTVKQE